MDKKGGQIGALPFRMKNGGEIEFLLVTSRETARWVIPKGWPMKGRKPHEAAAIEAFEEAGVRGRIARKSVGRYAYDKRTKTGVVPLVVKVFPMLVQREYDRYKEREERLAAWMGPDAASDAVDEPGLKALIEDFARKLTPQASPAP